ncbi:TerD family protein [Streptomyces sp. Je 1-79]|uniref:TerD family protein n=1 Tax=Streptomyces sp. Je 1-79 TaxID=2943847 RepID=UPI0021A5B17A|nr:TerD family protein [Streptomyces sp. Je 1-79]MCT4352824.1 TerD family protein [Streptomyces sp. Je 1-79]
MGHIAKDVNSWVPSVTLRVATPKGLDLSALLLGADGRVRGDADMVFVGQPHHPSGTVRNGSAGLEVDLCGVEASVERIVIAGSVEDGSLADVPAASVNVSAPDGASVAGHPVPGGAPDETAVVLGEFHRESGGWKFRAVGQGYASGLAGLVGAYGVEVAEEEPPAEPAAPLSGPVPLTGVVKVPGPPPAEGSREAEAVPESVPESVPASASASASAPHSPFPSADRPYALVEGWEFGPVFEPFVVEGHGADVITTDTRVPPGPVLVELAHQGDDYVSLQPLDKRNKDTGDFLFTNQLPEFRGSRVVAAPEKGPLRLRLSAPNRWNLRVQPVAAARRLRGTLRGYGPEALLHTGGAADLRMEFEDAPTGDGGYASIWCHEVAGLTALSPDPSLILSKTGARRETVPLPPGPLVLLLTAGSRWTFTLDELD